MQGINDGLELQNQIMAVNQKSSSDEFRNYLFNLK
jgi:hypothetical protein